MSDNWNLAVIIEPFVPVAVNVRSCHSSTGRQKNAVSCVLVLILYTPLPGNKVATRFVSILTKPEFIKPNETVTVSFDQSHFAGVMLSAINMLPAGLSSLMAIIIVNVVLYGDPIRQAALRIIQIQQNVSGLL
jgi:hypothetical protein